MFYNNFYSIDDLLLNQEQKEQVLEYLARQLYFILTELGMDDHHKTYDPLTIEGGIAHSYVFELGDGGRHHKFSSLSELENLMVTEVIQTIKKLKK